MPLGVGDGEVTLDKRESECFLALVYFGAS